MSKILVVDDNVTNLKVVNEILADCDYEVFFASSGERALEIVSRVTPDLILLDVMMPEMNGFETCKRLKETADSSDIPVIFITALNDSENLVKGFNAGAVDYVTKPFNRAELLARIKTHIELREMQQEIVDKNARLEDALKFKNQVISMASHELRRPLTMIIMLAQMIERTCKKESLDTAVKDCQTISQQVKAATNMLNEFILMAKSELQKVRFRPTSVNVKELCAEVIDAAKLLPNAKHEVIFKFDSPIEVIKADPILLKHILENLISNAIKYSPEADSVDFFFDSDSEIATFTIRDYGIGIPKKNQVTLFDAFVRADNASDFEGCGLGLSIVKQFVEMHGGTITFSSIEGKGSTFIVKLPIEPALTQEI